MCLITFISWSHFLSYAYTIHSIHVISWIQFVFMHFILYVSNHGQTRMPSRLLCCVDPLRDLSKKVFLRPSRHACPEVLYQSFHAVFGSQKHGHKVLPRPRSHILRGEINPEVSFVWTWRWIFDSTRFRHALELNTVYNCNHSFKIRGSHDV